MGDTPKASPTTERATGFAGVLEVHVVEAKELPGTKKAKEDKLSPYVELRLASKEKDKQSTLAAKGVRGERGNMERWRGGKRRKKVGD